jgi:hypothetical protein
MEYWVLYALMLEVAFFCDYLRRLGYKQTTYPETKWPRELVQWNHFVQAIFGTWLSYHALRILIWLLI